MATTPFLPSTLKDLDHPIVRSFLRELWDRTGAAAGTESALLADITASAAEINKLDEMTASKEDLNATTNFEETVSATTSRVSILATKELNVVTDGKLLLAGTAVTSSAAELNLIDGSIAGTSVASKALVLGSNKNTDLLTVDTTLTVQAETINPIIWVETTIAFSDMSGGASKTIKSSSGSKQYKIREIFLSGAGTNFEVLGDRNISITDNTSTYSVLPAATIKALTASRWGLATHVPFPTTAAHINTATVAGTALVAKYSGGATDYTDGSLTLLMCLEKVA